MSGGEQAGINSDRYHLVVSGGISSWDYDRVRANSQALGKALEKVQPKLDQVFQETVAQLNLKIARLGDHKMPDYVDGALIESDARKEAMSQEHFNTYFSFKRHKVASAHVSMQIPNTSFQATLSILVMERTRRDHLEEVLRKMIERMLQSDDLKARLY